MENQTNKSEATKATRNDDKPDFFCLLMQASASLEEAADEWKECKKLSASYRKQAKAVAECAAKLEAKGDACLAVTRQPTRPASTPFPPMENPTNNKSEATTATQNNHPEGYGLPPVKRDYQTGLTNKEAFAMVRRLREAGFLVLCLTPGDLMQKHADRVQDAEDDGEHSTMPKHHREEMTYQEAAEALRDEEEAISSWTEWSEDTLQSAFDIAMASRDSAKAAQEGGSR